MKLLDAKKLENTLKARTEGDIALHRVAGAAMTVTQSGETVCDLRLGVRDIRTGEPLPPNAIFRLASMTKPVTGVAALVAVEKGYFDIRDRVADYIPGIADMKVGRMSPDGVIFDRAPETEMRIYHLLSHTAGFCTDDEIGVYQKARFPQRVYTDIAAMTDHCVKNTFLSFAPGEKYEYSGTMGYDLVARIIENKSGMKYADFVKKYIFDPLGIKDLTFAPTDEQWGRFVAMHDKSNPSMVTVDMGKHVFEQFPLTYTTAGAGLCGSIEEYAKIAGLLLGRGEYRGARVFDEKLLSLMTTPYVPDGTPGLDPEYSWGLGVHVAVHTKTLPHGAFGWSGAYGPHFWVDPENEITAIYMKNNRWFDSHGAGNTGLQFEKDVMSSFKE